ncbi:hypothetical protein [Streptomyces sp. NPDC051310]|uniref:hypothetical protein n=1 Tax=Streptomyces sp. NPDC051310 TaxID=3365649 RepID=UPI0037B0EDD6
MANRPKVVVEPPDLRGLRGISIGGEPVGSVWSLRELRRVLRRLGYQRNMDVHDRSSIHWRGGGSETWPDRTWVRRITSALMIVGLLGSMVMLILIGIPDAFNALTFAQRVAGGVFILSGVYVGMAALAAIDYFGKRQWKYAGAVVLLGVLITLGTTSMLLFLWLQETEYTRYLFAYLPLWVWSAWALWPLLRGKAWRGTPHPKKFAAGVAATALIATVNLAYSVVYQPASAPILFKLTARLGSPIQTPDRQTVYVPLKLHAKNIGKVAAYVINDDFSVYGNRVMTSEKSEEGLRGRRKALTNEETADLHADPPEWETVTTGKITSAGTHFEPGEEFSYEKVIQLPSSATYDSMEVVFNMDVLRRDRGRIDNEFFIPHYSWDDESACPPAECGEFVTHRGRLRHNNNLINVTRRPVYVNAVYAMDRDDSYTYTYLSSSTDDQPDDPAEAEQESEREGERYGVSSLTANTAVPFAALLQP